jgi:DUF1680 family protein
MVRRRTTTRSRPGTEVVRRNAGFWCCHGTGVENFSKLADSAYFRDDDGIWVNLFVPSDVSWKEKGMRLVQDTRFPESDTTALTVHVTKLTRMALRVRVPYWVGEGGWAKPNGRHLDAFAGWIPWSIALGEMAIARGSCRCASIRIRCQTTARCRR